MTVRQPPGELIVLGHFLSQPNRLALVQLALHAARREADREAAKGNPRRGPKGREITRLARHLDVTPRTVTTWTNGEEPSDQNTIKLLVYLHDQDGRIAQRVRALLEKELTWYHQAVEFYVNGQPLQSENREEESSPFLTASESTRTHPEETH